jgi:hypothetical protein
LHRCHVTSFGAARKRKDGGRGTCASGQRHNAFLVRCRVTPCLVRYKTVAFLHLHTSCRLPCWFLSSPVFEHSSNAICDSQRPKILQHISRLPATMPICLPFPRYNSTPNRQPLRINQPRTNHQPRIRGSAARILSRAARAVGTVFVAEKGWTRGMVVGCGGVWER